MLIGLDGDMTPIDIEFLRSKVKVKKCFPGIILRTVHHKLFIFHILIGLVKCLTPIEFGFFRSKVKVTRVTFIKNVFCLIP